MTLGIHPKGCRHLADGSWAEIVGCELEHPADAPGPRYSSPEAWQKSASRLPCDPLPLPLPRRMIPASEVVASDSRLISTVAVPGYARGYCSVIEDEYQPAFVMNASHEPEQAWLFSRRVQRFRRPIHLDGPCEECREWWGKVPDMPDCVLIDGESLRCEF